MVGVKKIIEMRDNGKEIEIRTRMGIKDIKLERKLGRFPDKIYLSTSNKKKERERKGRKEGKKREGWRQRKRKEGSEGGERKK